MSSNSLLDPSLAILRVLFVCVACTVEPGSSVADNGVTAVRSLLVLAGQEFDMCEKDDD